MGEAQNFLTAPRNMAGTGVFVSGVALEPHGSTVQGTGVDAAEGSVDNVHG